MKCPMCGESMLLECSSCGWKKPPKVLDAIADTVLKYRPKARSKPAVQRKRRKTILEKKREAGKE